MSETLVGAVAEFAAREQETPAVIAKRYGKWVEHDLSEIADDASRIAGGLGAIGVTSGETVAMIMSGRLEWITIDLAVQAIGAVSLALPRTILNEQMEHLLTETGVRTVVVEGQDQADLVLSSIDEGRLTGIDRLVYVERAGVSEYSAEILHGIDEIREAGSDAPLSSRISGLDPSATAVLAPRPHLTSTVPVSHATLLQSARSTVEAFSLTPQDRVVSLRDIADPVERGTTVYAALLSGAILAIPENPATATAAVHEIAPTYLHVSERWLTTIAARITVRFDENRGLKKRLAWWWRRRTGSNLERYGSARPPAGIWRLVVTLPVLEEFGLEKARAVVVTGQPSPKELLGFYQALGLPIRAGLGLARLSGFATSGRPADVDGWVGSAMPGVAAEVSDGTLHVTTPATGRFDTGIGAEPAEGGFVAGTSSPEAAAETRLRSIPVFSSAIVSDGAETVTIELDGGIASRWATKNHLDAATYISFSRLPEMQEGVEQAVAAVFKRFDLRPGTVQILPAPLHQIRGGLGLGDVPNRQVAIDRAAE